MERTQAGPPIAPRTTLKRPPRFRDLSDKPLWIRVLLHVAAVLLLILGLIGFVLPILQGFLFTFFGLILLASANRGVRRALDRWLDRHPKMDRMFWKSVLFLGRLRGRTRARRARARLALASDGTGQREESARGERQPAIRSGA